MNERIAIIDGIRTPFCKSGGVYKILGADDLGAFVVTELLARTEFPVEDIDEVIFGNAMQPVDAINIARVIALKAGLPVSTPAYTVQRNCSSGMESISTAANKILAGEAEVILAGSCESMTHAPLLFPEAMKDFMMGMMKALHILLTDLAASELMPVRQRRRCPPSTTRNASGRHSSKGSTRCSRRRQSTQATAAKLTSRRRNAKPGRRRLSQSNPSAAPGP